MAMQRYESDEYMEREGEPKNKTKDGSKHVQSKFGIIWGRDFKYLYSLYIYSFSSSMPK